jgi:ferrochelatase
MPREPGAVKDAANTERLGVLVANLGTPDAPTPEAIKRYLGEFLADPLVIDLPRWFWLPLLHFVILNLRPRKVAHAYRKVWTEQGSPLMVQSRAQAEALELALAPRLPNSRVELGMRYGNPSLKSALERLREWGATRLVILPLYPQYSRTTTGSTHAMIDCDLQGMAWDPAALRLLSYHDHPGYIGALAASVREHWSRRGRGARLLMSFHGLPQRYVDNGDPYQAQCRSTAQLLAAALDLRSEQWAIAYQSRVGAEKWLTPYTDQLLADWAAQRVGDVDAICPGFSADCLETLEEIAMQNAEAYAGLGGGELRYVPALNARPDHIGFLADLIAARAHELRGPR